MARFIFPLRFADQVKLFKKIKSKDTTLGAASVIKQYLLENGIVLADDEIEVDASDAHHATFEQHGKDGEKLLKERDKLFNPVFKTHPKGVQFLKSLYTGNIGKLGDWSVTVNGNRIVYPADFAGRQSAVLQFINKHLSFAPGTSPIPDVFFSENNIDFAVNLANAVLALTHHTNGTQMHIDKETERGSRDTRMAPVITHMKGIGKNAMKIYASNPNKAGDYGFIIDNSPQGTKVRIGFVNILSTKTLTSLAIGGVLINQSEFDIEMTKGKTFSGTPHVLKPGKPFVIVTGYGSVTLRNPNDEVKAMYQGVFNR